MNKNVPADTLEVCATEDRVIALEEENRKLRQLAHEAERLRRENETMRSKKRLGLVWEQDSLEEEEAAFGMSILPRLVFEEQGRAVARPEGNSGNLVIEGDNLDALRLLSKTHKGKVDCIYIDPPYNTGMTTFVYNDRFVDKEHRWRKSLWLDFLNKRLILARDLLSERGVILVSINDEHRSILELLLDEVMPGKRIGSLVWKTRSGSNDSKDSNMSSDHEHILIYGNPGFQFRGDEKDSSSYKNPDKDPRGRWKTGDLSKSHTRHEREKAYYPIQNPDSGVWYPCNPNRVWAFATEKGLTPEERSKLRAETMEEYIRQGKVIFPDQESERVETFDTMDSLLAAIRSGDVPLRPKNRAPLLTEDLPDLDSWVGRPIGYGRPWFKRHLKDLKSNIRPISSWIRGMSEEAGDDWVIDLVSQRSGTGEASVNEILGANVFHFPKPVSLIRSLIEQATDRDSLVLDFFAGSGTTAHAVMVANAQDGGSRRFIMVSSTEATDKEPQKNVCRDVCAPRIKAACEGYGSGKKSVSGTGDGFAYLRLERVPAYEADDQMDDHLAWTLLQIQHDRPVTEFAPTNGVMIDDGGETAIALCSEITDEALDTLRIATTKPMILYTEYPGYAAEKLSGCAIEARPAYDTAIRIAK